MSETTPDGQAKQPNPATKDTAKSVPAPAEQPKDIPDSSESPKVAPERPQGRQVGEKPASAEGQSEEKTPASEGEKETPALTPELAQESQINRLKTENPELAEKATRWRELEGKDPEKLTDEERQERDKLTRELLSNPDVQKVLDDFMQEEGFTKKQLEEIDTKDGEEATEEDIKAVGERIDALKRHLQEALANPTEEIEQVLARELGDIGDSKLMKIIKRSKGPLAKGSYGVWMATLITLWLSFKALHLVSRAMGGGGK